MERIPLLDDLGEEDLAALDAILLERINGPFEPLEPDWKEKVRQNAAKLKTA